jgi:hypothetical protein
LGVLERERRGGLERERERGGLGIFKFSWFTFSYFSCTIMLFVEIGKGGIVNLVNLVNSVLTINLSFPSIKFYPKLEHIKKKKSNLGSVRPFGCREDRGTERECLFGKNYGYRIFFFLFSFFFFPEQLPL